MKRVFGLVIIALLTSSLTFGQMKDKNGKGQSTQPEKELLRIEQEITSALVKGNTAVFERYYADDCIMIGLEGELGTKAGLIAALKSGSLDYDSSRIDQIKVRVYGNMAVVTFRATDKGREDGKEFSGQRRWTDVLVRRGGRWQIVTEHGTRIVKQ